MTKQEAKETACLMAIQSGFALIRRDSEIHALHPSGETALLSQSVKVDDVWFDALMALHDQPFIHEFHKKLLH
jgi:hypothetical protein